MILDPHLFANAGIDLVNIVKAELVAAIAVAGAYAAKHMHNAFLQQLEKRGASLMADIVNGLNVQTVNDLKAAGTWGPNEKESVRLAALAQWKAQARGVLIKALSRGRQDLTSLLNTWLQNAVAQSPTRVNTVDASKSAKATKAPAKPAEAAAPATPA